MKVAFKHRLGVFHSIDMGLNEYPTILRFYLRVDVLFLGS